ncbi:MAG: FAD binding domain-containing protein [Nitrososphaeria archaeon]
MRTFEYLIPMPEFDYARPSSLNEALKLLEQDGAYPIAGGTDIIILIGDGKLKPRLLVDLGGLGLSYIREEKEDVVIGATTTFQELADSELIGRYTCLSESARNVGTWQIRNLGTIGGNLANASPAADSAPPLLVLDARVVIARRDGEREVALSEFFVGSRKTVLNKGEIIKEVRFSRKGSDFRCRWERIGRRSQNTLSVVSVAVGGSVDGEIIRNARIALGAVAPTPMLVRGAMRELEGRQLLDETINKAAELASEESRPITDVRGTMQYRKLAIRVLTARLLRSIRGW